ncbi:MAG: YqgE/AlgH family protein [Flavobacteriales bacterium]|nr:YqgE/AlgH family protein [Flavobacteriales bacterium]
MMNRHTPIKKARQGRYLIAEPMLLDQSFNRTVVLLTEYNEEGFVGFVLNKPMDLYIHELVPELPESDFPVFFGGPVQNDSIFYVHTLGSRVSGSLHIAGDLYWGGDFDELKALMHSGSVNPQEIRFFMGYSGWSPRQLEGELEEKSWVVLEAGSIDPLNDAPGTMWKKVLLHLGDDYKIWANAPKDPMLN